jgi:hypothetical protein
MMQLLPKHPGHALAPLILSRSAGMEDAAAYREWRAEKREAVMESWW